MMRRCTRVSCPRCHRSGFILYSGLYYLATHWRGRLWWSTGADAYQYIRTPKEKVCTRCLSNIERKFIKHLPLENLPLRVAHRWVFLDNEKFFERRLEEGV